MINNLKKYCFLSLVFLSAILRTNAQAKTMDSATLAATIEMTNISFATEAYNNQQFDMTIINSDGTNADTTIGNCMIQGDNYRCIFDSVEQIQNNFMNLEIHYDGKIFVATKPTSFSKQFFKSNVDQALFQQMNINTISISTVGADKKLTFNFLAESEYAAYTITYNPATYRVSAIYLQQKLADSTGAFSSNFITTNITFQNFTALSGTVSFDTSPYVFIGAGNIIQKQVAYNDYQVIDMLNRNN